MFLPGIRFRLRTILIVLSLFVLVLPVVGIQALRLYESALVRQTESALIAQTAFVAASFRSRFLEAARTSDDLDIHSRPRLHPEGSAGARRLAVLDLADAKLLPSFPIGGTEATADDVAATAGRALTPILGEVQTRADIRVTDHRGVVVAAVGDGLGEDLSAAEEVTLALDGKAASRLRSLPGEDPPALAVLVRGAAVLVSVTSPVVVDDRVVGAVLATQAPSSILDALHSKRFLLLQAAGLLFAVVVATAIFTSRTLVRPIRRLVAGTEGITRGDASELDTDRYRTIELAQLAASVSEMATSLQRRTGYVRDLARSISHEFKTPLAAMSGALEVLGDHFDHMTRAERERFIGNLAGDVARIETLTRRLLELAQADMRGKPVGTATVAELTRGDVLPHDIEIRTAGDTDTVLPIDAESLGAILRGLGTTQASTAPPGCPWRSAATGRTPLWISSMTAPASVPRTRTGSSNRSSRPGASRAAPASGSPSSARCSPMPAARSPTAPRLRPMPPERRSVSVCRHRASSRFACRPRLPGPRRVSASRGCLRSGPDCGPCGTGWRPPYVET